MNTLDFTKPKWGKDGIRFEEFGCIFMSHYLNSEIMNKNSAKKQCGFDIVTCNGENAVECKNYSNTITKTDITRFLNEIQENIKLIENTNIKNIYFLFSSKYSVSELDRIYKIEKTDGNIDIKIKYCDIDFICNKIHENKLYSLVSRFFDEEEFKAFFGQKNYHEYFGSSEKDFTHYSVELAINKENKYGTEIKEGLIKAGKVFIDENLINEIENKINEHRICVIQALEGRGKTVLSRIFAYEKYRKEDFDVFFCDLRNGVEINEIRNKLDYLSNNENEYLKPKTLIIFENEQSYQFSLDFLTIVEDFIQNSNNLYFLINTRKIENEYKNKPYLINLKPDEIYFNNLIRLNNFEIKKSTNIEVLNKVFRENYDNVNLRLLYLYLKNISLLTEDTQIDIYRKFLNPYFVNNTNDCYKEQLIKLSAISKFDAPFIIYENDSEIYRYFEILSNQGLLKKKSNNFNFLHSVDAQFFFDAICFSENSDVTQIVKKHIIEYINYILQKYPNFPEDPKPILYQLVKSINADEKLVELKRELFHLENELPKKIIEQIDAGYLNGVISYHSIIKETDTALNYVINSFSKLKKGLLNTNCFILAFINNTLKKYYKYKELPVLLFDDYFVSKNWIEKVFEFKSKNLGGLVKIFIDDIKLVSVENEKLINGLRSNRRKVEIKQNHFNFKTKSKKNHIVNKGFFDYINYCENKDESKLIFYFSNIAKGFYSFDINWKQLSRVFFAIKNLIEISTNDNLIELGKKASKRMFIDILDHPDCFKFADSKSLSLIYRFLGSIDEKYYNTIIVNEIIRKDFELRINKFEYTIENFYLCNHFIKSNFKLNELRKLYEEVPQEVKASWDEVLKSEGFNDNYEKMIPSSS